jgi:hypothetical protein
MKKKRFKRLGEVPQLDEKTFNAYVQKAVSNFYNYGKAWVSIISIFKPVTPKKIWRKLIQNTVGWKYFILPRMYDIATEYLVRALIAEKINYSDINKFAPYIDNAVNQMIDALKKGFFDELKRKGLLIEEE